ncbi:MAG: CsgG/HfaB family protein [Burkholderiaceae bacterium]
MRTNEVGAAVVLAVSAVAGPAWAQDTSSVEKCAKKLGTIAVVDPRSGLGGLQRVGLGSPSTLLRSMIQASGCFDVVERGVAMQNLQQERALAQSGQLKSDSNVGQGQMQAADFVMTPDVQLSASNTGGVGGAVGGLLGNKIGLPGLGAVAGGLKFKEAATSLLIADVRSSIQVAAAEGKATKTDFSVGGWGLAGGVLGALGGYTSTPEGKIVAASFLDNYNKIVLAIRDKPSLIQTGSAESQANAQASTKAEAPQQAGQMLMPRIANVKAYAEPSRESAVVATLQKGDELIASGEVKNGFVKVDSANFSGWVQRTLVSPGGR